MKRVIALFLIIFQVFTAQVPLEAAEQAGLSLSTLAPSQTTQSSSRGRQAIAVAVASLMASELAADTASYESDFSNFKFSLSKSIQGFPVDRFVSVEDAKKQGKDYHLGDSGAMLNGVMHYLMRVKNQEAFGIATEQKNLWNYFQRVTWDDRRVAEWFLHDYSPQRMSYTFLVIMPRFLSEYGLLVRVDTIPFPKKLVGYSENTLIYTDAALSEPNIYEVDRVRKKSFFVNGKHYTEEIIDISRVAKFQGQSLAPPGGPLLFAQALYGRVINFKFMENPMVQVVSQALSRSDYPRSIPPEKLAPIYPHNRIARYVQNNPLIYTKAYGQAITERHEASHLMQFRDKDFMGRLELPFKMAGEYEVVSGEIVLNAEVNAALIDIAENDPMIPVSQLLRAAMRSREMARNPHSSHTFVTIYSVLVWKYVLDKLLIEIDRDPERYGFNTDILTSPFSELYLQSDQSLLTTQSFARAVLEEQLDKIAFMDQQLRKDLIGRLIEVHKSEMPIDLMSYSPQFQATNLDRYHKQNSFGQVLEQAKEFAVPIGIVGTIGVIGWIINRRIKLRKDQKANEVVVEKPEQIKGKAAKKAVKKQRVKGFKNNEDGFIAPQVFVESFIPKKAVSEPALERVYFAAA